jgi:ABC-2 type transport system permease protein
MAVYRRSYRAYSGERTTALARFFVIPRFALTDLFAGRTVAFLVLCMVPAVAKSLFIYAGHNPAVKALLIVPLSAIDAHFFVRCVSIQAFLAFVLACWIGPSLVAPDLANGALSLYLSRPISRTEYLAGKFMALAGLLLLITWVPVLFLYLLQASLEAGWLASHLRIGFAILLGSVLWVALLSLMALTLSAVVKRRQTASLLLAVVFFGGAAFGEIWRDVLGSPWGRIFNLEHLIEVIWYQLFGLARPLAMGGVRMDQRHADLPIWAAWVALLGFSAGCLWLLDRRVRAKEIA